MPRAIIISAPSGAGKTTLVKNILKHFRNIEFSVSTTTRQQRHYEVEGKDYYFETVEEFKKDIDNNAFIEWEEVYPNHFYGTKKIEIDRIWNKNNSVVFDVDVIGGLNLKRYFNNNGISIFIKPPSIESLRERLLSRDTETEANIEMRLEKAVEELEYENKYDTVILNEDLEKSKIEIREIVDNFLSLKAR